MLYYKKIIILPCNVHPDLRKNNVIPFLNSAGWCRAYEAQQNGAILLCWTSQAQLQPTHYSLI